MDQQWTNCYREKGFHASYYLLVFLMLATKPYKDTSRTRHDVPILFPLLPLFASLCMLFYSPLRRRVCPNESVCAWAFILWSAICIL